MIILEKRMIALKCELEYCVYNKRSTCVLDEIEVNTLGMCALCTTLSFDADFLEREKERQRQEYVDSWTELG